MPDMKAVRIHAYGDPKVLKYEEAPRPTPQDGEILLRVHAAGVNPVDWKIREGYLKDAFPAQFPLVLGFDVAGTVEAVGAGVTEFAPGDAVYADVRSGGYAEYVISPAKVAARKPQALDFVQAASLPVAALTAWQALFDHAHLEVGQTVLIHAASGGVGHLAVQFAKDKGAHVIATASARNHEFVKGLGADELIDYNTTKFETVAHDVDVVLDTIGGDTQERSWGVLKPGGILVSIVDPDTEKHAQAHGRRGVIFHAEDSGAQLAQIAGMADAGKLKPYVERVFPLSEARQAHETSQGGHVRGKLVLQVAA